VTSADTRRMSQSNPVVPLVTPPRWSFPRDTGFQSGLRLAVFSPFLSLPVGGFLLSASAGSGEAGLGWGLLHVAAFGVIEAAWIAPVAAISAVLHFRRFALGLAVGGAMLLLANGFAWLVGLSIGAR
jgi:hypothetical protein